MEVDGGEMRCWTKVPLSTSLLSGPALLRKCHVSKNFSKRHRSTALKTNIADESTQMP